MRDRGGQEAGQTAGSRGARNRGAGWLGVGLAGLAVAVAACGDPSSPPERVAGVEVTPALAALEPGQVRQYTATARTARGAVVDDAEVRWSTEDTLVAAITGGGVLTARGGGRTRVRAEAEGVAGYGDLRVDAPPVPGPVATVTLDMGDLRVLEGQYPTFSAVARDSAGVVVAGAVVRWTSSDPSVAPVDPEGQVVALRPGTARITATVEAVSDTARVEVWADHAFDLLYAGWAGEPGVAPELFRLDIRDPAGSPTPVRVAGVTIADAAPSPDGRRMAFVADPHTAGGGLYLADIDGSNPVRLTADPYDAQPAWSPDGTRIAFRRWRYDDGEDADIWVVAAAGGEPVNLTDGLGATNQSWPTWSPMVDGRSRIAFSHAADGLAHIWVMGEDGAAPAPLTAGEVWDDQPAWSPAGELIAFQRTTVGSSSDLYLIGSWGGAGRPVMQANDPPGSQWAPSWSPDGELIAFTSRHERLGPNPDAHQVYTTDPFGRRVARRTADATDKSRPVWATR